MRILHLHRAGAVLLQVRGKVRHLAKVNTVPVLRRHGRVETVLRHRLQ
jgi:hypothetical protein